MLLKYQNDNEGHFNQTHNTKCAKEYNINLMSNWATSRSRFECS